MSEPWEKICLNDLRDPRERYHGNIPSCEWCHASNPHYVPAAGRENPVQPEPVISSTETNLPRPVSDPADTPSAPIAPSVSLAPISNLALHQGPPPVPGMSSLPPSQATYGNWAMQRLAHGLSTTPRFLGAEAIGDSKARDSQKDLAIAGLSHAGSVPPSHRSSMGMGISSTLGSHLIPPPGGKKGKQTPAVNLRPFTITWWKQKGYHLTYAECIESVDSFIHIDPAEEQSKHCTLLYYQLYSPFPLLLCLLICLYYLPLLLLPFYYTSAY